MDFTEGPLITQMVAGMVWMVGFRMGLFAATFSGYGITQNGNM